MQPYTEIAAYRQVKEDIVADILGGIYPVGSTIKGQTFYAKKYNVSRTTVRRAFEELVERGLLYTIKGKGTYVKSRTAYLPITPSAQRVSQETAPPQYPQASFRLMRIEIVGANRRIAKRLAIQEGDPVICIERLKLIDKVAGNYQYSYLNRALVEKINFFSEDLETGSLYRLLIHKAQLIPHHSDETIRAIGCPPEIARHFGLRADAPILFVARVTSGEDGRVIEYCEDYEATDVNGLQRRCYHDNEDDYKRHRWYADR